jgi:hypothetical protein
MRPVPTIARRPWVDVHLALYTDVRESVTFVLAYCAIRYRDSYKLAQQEGVTREVKLVRVVLPYRPGNRYNSKTAAEGWEG